jgi:Fe-S-cluster containining protein
MAIPSDIDKFLVPYRNLLATIDRLLERIRRRYSAHIACTKGCPCGCRNLSIFPVEALYLAIALRELPAQAAARIQERAAAASFWDCPLLEDQACSLYPFRPIICRTHGFPLQTVYNGRPAIGHCRHNFKNMSSIPADAIIDLDSINAQLRAINTTAVTEMAPDQQLPDRLSIANAVLLAVSDEAGCEIRH